jgi:hypothetical protein
MLETLFPKGDPKTIIDVTLDSGRVVEMYEPVALAREAQKRRDAQMREERGLLPNQCAWCGDTGRDIDSGVPCWCDPGIRVARQAERDREWELVVPKRMAHFTLNSCPNDELVVQMFDWLKTDPFQTGNGLVLSGKVGGGKTGAAIGALRYFHDIGAHVMYAHVQTLLDDIKRSWDAAKYTPKYKMPEYQAERAGLLLLDDLGAERETEYSVQVVNQIISTRYDDMRPTIITSNLDTYTFQQHLRERLMSRLGNSATVIELDPRTPDYRVGGDA